ncbi:DNA mismatch repair endonuclease MutL [bacterium]|nr:DNA mismatch repair endonuclease MutL [bacterium]
MGLNLIKILPEHVSNKIAAGEIVLRPASAVKELIENSIDAGATRIVINIKAGGQKLIEVIDNGTGMGADDAVLALERFSTSKISSVNDIFQINTLGFRGEALPSMASVSRLELITKSKDSPFGFFIKTVGGKIIKSHQTGRADGTTVRIEDLFFNTLPRRKFLKSEATEMSHILNAITFEALARPDIFFKLVHDRRELINIGPSNNLLKRITSLFGEQISNNLLPIEGGNDLLNIYGFISKPEETRANRNSQLIFINKRCAHNKSISHSIYEAYRTLVPRGRFPVAFIFIDTPPAAIDVNIHPTKDEVKFFKEKIVHELIGEAIKQALSTHDLSPGLFNIQTSKASEKNQESEIKEAIGKYIYKQKMQERVPEFDFLKEKKIGSNEIEKQKFEIPPKYIQVFETYIITQLNGHVVIIDQHAAHERIVYEKLTKDLSLSKVESQGLLIDETLDLNYRQAVVFEKYLDYFKSLGFQIEPFGKNSFSIRSVPALLKDANTPQVISDVLDELIESEKAKKIGDLTEEIIKLIACHSAIRAGARLKEEEIESLLRQLSSSENKYTCPHGRPTMIKLSKYELEKKFKRA